VVVCDFGGGFEASVLRRAPAGFEVLSTIDAPDGAGSRIDEVLADELARIGGDRSTHDAEAPPLSDADGLVLLASARTAKETLTHSAAVAATLPAPRRAVVLHSTQLEALARPVLVRAARAAREAVDAAGISPEDLAGVYCIGGRATPLAARVLGEETGLSPVIADDRQVAAVLGAAEAIGAPGTAADVESLPVAAPPVPPVWRALGLIVPGVASLGLWAHFVFSAERSGTRSRGFAIRTRMSWRTGASWRWRRRLRW
jgi:molecular chaperone DnaK (HSP70)